MFKFTLWRKLLKTLNKLQLLIINLFIFQSIQFHFSDDFVIIKLNKTFCAGFMAHVTLVIF